VSIRGNLLPLSSGSKESWKNLSWTLTRYNNPEDLSTHLRSCDSQYPLLKLFIKFRQYQAYLQAIHTKFSRLANTQLSTYCSTDTITNQDIKVILHSVKIEYKFLHLPHNSPSSFNTHKWPDSRGHYSIAFKVPFRADNSISLHECLSENSDREKISKYEIYTWKDTHTCHD
jgi:hypothetical protein